MMAKEMELKLEDIYEGQIGRKLPTMFWIGTKIYSPTTF